MTNQCFKNHLTIPPLTMWLVTNKNCPSSPLPAPPPWYYFWVHMLWCRFMAFFIFYIAIAFLDCIALRVVIWDWLIFLMCLTNFVMEKIKLISKFEEEITLLFHRRSQKTCRKYKKKLHVHYTLPIHPSQMTIPFRKVKFIGPKLTPIPPHTPHKSLSNFSKII